MLDIRFDQVAKRFQYEWIFRNLSLKIEAASKWAITGANGSGKSTLLKCISGLTPFTSGKITYHSAGKEIPIEAVYTNLAFSAPYMELPEEFTLTELLNFHFKFKNPRIALEEIPHLMYLHEHRHKAVSQFSSGMKQRLKLGLCLFSDVPLLLLDEPTSNLDEKGIAWYQEMIQIHAAERTVIVCSNDPKEYQFCNQILSIENYKQQQKL
jgi:ABC-type multidrug transport system ATPase subunit